VLGGSEVGFIASLERHENCYLGRMKRLVPFLLIVLVLALVGLARQMQFPSQHLEPYVGSTPTSKSVRFVYMVSADRQENPAYRKGVVMAAVNIQAWYKKQLGTTFKLNGPIVEVVHSKQKATWFYANPNGDDRDVWGYNNTLEEGKRLLDVKLNDPEYIWVIYSDGPGKSGRGGSGVCIMPEDDLLGLIGKHPEQKEINRWIAGLGHEVGHAFGLSHPDDIEKDADAIMWTGIYGKYPDHCYLTAEDKRRLNESPFFFDDRGQPNSGTWKELAQYEYEDGYFTRSQNSKSDKIGWEETKKDRSASFRFHEESTDDDYFYLQSVDRDLMISIPFNGGESYISTDEGNTWDLFTEVELVK
jgi:hypothetical protein